MVPEHAPGISPGQPHDPSGPDDGHEMAVRGEQVSDVGTLIAEIEASFRSGTVASRSAMLRRITDLFLDGADEFDEPQVEVFDDVLCQLVKKIEREAIVELSNAIAPVARAPSALTRHLSHHDDIAISGPVLRQSSMLSDADLIEIALSKGQQHLVAIASRRHISEDVTDVLVDRGESEVLSTVAGNFGARFSSQGYDTLLDKAEHDADVAMAVVMRKDLSPEMFRKLVARAATTVQQRLLTIANPSVRERLTGVLQEISLQILRDAGGKKANIDAQHTPQTDTLDREKLRSELHDYARAGQLPESATALGTLSGVSAETIKRLVAQREIDALMIVCKASGIGWSTVRALINLSVRLTGDSTLHAMQFLDQYTKMTVESAQRVMRFIHARKAVSGGDLKKMMLAS
jgi:uncharacterized protein (DUF2336 family)